MADPVRFSVIIANHNGGDYLTGALASLAAQSVCDFEVFIVDNASSDGSVEAALRACLPEVAVAGHHLDLELPSSCIAGAKMPLHVRAKADNLGFAAANNLAAREATGTWLVLLNPDAEAEPDWLHTLGRASERHPRTAMFASAQINLHEPALLDGAGDAYLGFGIPWRGGFGRPASELPGEGACFSPCGAGAMIRRDSFLSVGGFDERFFCYCEDVDLGYRLRLAGEHCIFLPDAVIRHAGGGLTGRASDFALFHGARNRTWTYLKNTPLRLLLPTLPVHVALILAILYRNRNLPHFRANLRGLRAALAGLGPFLAERKALKRTRKSSVAAIAGAMCWNIMLLRQRKPHIRPIKPETRP